jgi:hypothetical protein
MEGFVVQIVGRMEDPNEDVSVRGEILTWLDLVEYFFAREEKQKD